MMLVQLNKLHFAHIIGNLCKMGDWVRSFGVLGSGFLTPDSCILYSVRFVINEG
jgi:hypothetical protein